MTNQVINTETADSTYQNLYKMGGAAALVAAMLILGEVVVLAIYPPPNTISGWFMLFQRDSILGFLDFWGLEVPMYLMFIMIYLALYMALRKINPSLMVIALTFALLGIGVFLATNNPTSMLSLSNQYAAATTDGERSTLLAAGQALFSNTNQRTVGGFNMGLFLVSVAGLMVSSAMLHSNSFNRSTAFVGILAHALSLADYLRQAITSSTIITLLVLLPNALFLLVWYVLVGLQLYYQGRLERKMLDKQS